MRCRTVIRKSAKWGGATVAILLAALWVGSAWWGGEYRPTQYSVHLAMGQVSVAWYAFPGQGQGRIWGPATGRPVPVGVRWWFAHGDVPRAMAYWSMPIWMPTLIVAGLAAWAWQRDFVATNCDGTARCTKCGYSLAGLPPRTACPECGNKLLIRNAAKAPPGA